MLEIIIIALALITGTEWLVSKLAKQPGVGFKGMSMGCGLFLVVSMSVMFNQAVTDPKEEFMAGLPILPWITLGVMLVVKAAKER